MLKSLGHENYNARSINFKMDDCLGLMLELPFSVDYHKQITNRKLIIPC